MYIVNGNRHVISNIIVGLFFFIREEYGPLACQVIIGLYSAFLLSWGRYIFVEVAKTL